MKRFLKKEFIILIILLLGFVIFFQSRKSNAYGDFNVKLAKSLIPEASGIPKALLQKLGQSATAPKKSDFKDFPLTLATLLFPVNEALEKQITFFGVPSPARLSEAFYPGIGKYKMFWDNTANLIHSHYITHCTFMVEKDQKATGTVYFEAPGVYKGSVEYVAYRIDKKWKIKEFHLPYYGLSLERQKDQGWQMKQEPLEETEIPMNLNKWRQENYPNATLIIAYKKQKNYLFKLKKEKDKTTKEFLVEVSPAKKIVHKSIFLEKAPENIQRTLKNSFKDWKIESIQQLISEEKETYQIIVRQNRVQEPSLVYRKKIVLNPKGEIQNQNEEAPQLKE